MKAKDFLKAAAAAIIAIAMPVFAYAGTDVSGYTAQEIVTDMKLGWNLGNALECYGGGSDPTSAETYWGNPKTTKELIDAVHNAGFNTVRIPVTWGEKCTNGTINANWLARVKEVVDYCYANDMYVIINIHHDDVQSKDNTKYYASIVPDEAHRESTNAWLSNMWGQIAVYFKDYDRHLIFETMNEPRLIGNDEWSTGAYETRVILSEYNQTAVDAIRATGGNNTNRLVMCPSNAAKIPATTGFTLPDDDNVALSVHNYSPYEFAMNAYGTSQWTSDLQNSLSSELRDLYNRYVSKGVPVVIGEMGATDKLNTAQRAAWAEFYTKTAKEYGITCVVWDNNEICKNSGDYGEKFGLVNRSNNILYYSSVVQGLVNGVQEADPYEPSASDPYESVLWEGSEAVSAYSGEFSIMDGIPDIKEGEYITVEYSPSSAQVPWLVFQKFGGNWNKINAYKVKNGVAYYSYSDIISGCTDGFYNQDQMVIQPQADALTVTKVSVVAPHLAGDVNNDGKVNEQDTAFILRYLGGMSAAGAYMTYGYVNADEVINILDAIATL